MQKAFTLIELLVVVLIIGILSAIALPQYQKSVHKARAAEAAVRVKAMEQAIDLYILEQGFPTSGTVDLFEVNPDLVGGLTKAADSVAHMGDTALYISKHVGYVASCSSTQCRLFALYSKSGNPGSWLNANSDITTITRILSKTSGWETGHCWWFAGGDKYGPAICSPLVGYVAESD